MNKIDVIVVGSGISGLSFSIKLAEKRKDISILLFTKSENNESNTRYAQGGIAGVFNLKEDSFQAHIQDTLKAGGGECNREIVEKIIRSAPERIEELENWGVNFTKDQKGMKNAALEGGHSFPRVIHAKDATGNEIENVLLQKIKNYTNIILMNHVEVIELLKKEDAIDGVNVMDKKKNSIYEIHSKVVVLSTGGCGQLFQFTTNPKIATGDGVALAYKIGAKIEGMNYIQFHPTAFFEKNKSPLFLISEAVRGRGAYIVNKEGERFVFMDDGRGELATRDIVTKAILKEMKRNQSENVFLDCRHISPIEFKNEFPTIHQYCEQNGINTEFDLIPIIPAAHYQCGGISVDENGETTITNLFAVGECSYTGMHGKNRLASNSLLEAIAFAHFASEKIGGAFVKETIKDEYVQEQLPISEDNCFAPGFQSVQEQLKKIMYEYGMINSSLVNIEKGLEKIILLENCCHKLMQTDSFFVAIWRLENAFILSKLILYQMRDSIINEQRNKKESLLLDK